MTQPAPRRPRVLVVANKSWEADPLVNVLLSDRTRPAELTDFVAVNHPLIRPPGFADPNPPAKPRITFKCGAANVEVWCIQDLMNPAPNLSSNSGEKARVLPQVFKAGDAPALVVAFGTAGFAEKTRVVGGVVMGSRVFIHDPKTDEATRYTPRAPDAVSAFTTPNPKTFFRGIDADVRFPAEGRFLRAPVAPARPPIIMAGNNWIAVGSVNVTNYDDYVWADAEALATFKELDPRKVSGRIGSMETTHGIIRELSDPAPFIFVSGITDVVPYFDIQVTPRVCSQNFVAAHNAGVALAWLVPEIVKQLGVGA